MTTTKINQEVFDGEFQAKVYLIYRGKRIGKNDFLSDDLVIAFENEGSALLDWLISPDGAGWYFTDKNGKRLDEAEIIQAEETDQDDEDLEHEDEEREIELVDAQEEWKECKGVTVEDTLCQLKVQGFVNYWESTPYIKGMHDPEDYLDKLECFNADYIDYLDFDNPDILDKNY